MNIPKRILLVGFPIIVFVACKKYEDSTIKIEDSFALSVIDTAGVRGNGRHIVKIQLDKTIEIKQGMKVTFQTNKGILLNNDVSFTQNSAMGLLKVDQDTGIYFITALLKDGSDVKVEKKINFSFLPANPDSVGLEPDKLLYNFTNNKQITMSTYLLRNNGLVTKGRTANFRAFQIGTLPTDTLQVGRFTGLFNNFSGVDGKLQTNVQFFADTPDIDSNKVVYIQSRSINDLGRTVIATFAARYVR